MALWRDPLDELIDDLERAVPAAAANPYRILPRVEDLQWLVSMILWRDNWEEELTDEEMARLEEHPRFQMLIRQLEASVRPRAGDQRRP